MPPVLIETNEVNKTYHQSLLGKSQAILSHCCIQINEGESVGLMGPSGSGKTTLGKILAGIERPDKGYVSFQGKDIHSANQEVWSEYRRSVQMLFQDPQGTFHPFRTIGQSIETVANLFGYSSSDYNNCITSLCNKVGIHPEVLSRYPDQISGGQAQRLALARILFSRPRLIILDEPTSGLDISVQAQILHLLREFQDQEKIAYLLISHDPAVVGFLTHRQYVIQNGIVTEIPKIHT